ncbi:CHAD domain-containing protein, partial [Priestia sp. SIMBA_032]|uniref:CHAD domain-containing protein n=1 Tax=Priestia sp. SIMBA_032 TaxID=3085775 RepID=UPI003977FB8D
PPERTHRLEAALKRVADGLGPARDQDVFLAELVGPLDTAMPEESEALGAVRAAAAEARAAGYDRVRATIADPDYTALVLE